MAWSDIPEELKASNEPVMFDGEKWVQADHYEPPVPPHEPTGRDTWIGFFALYIAASVIAVLVNDLVKWIF